MVPVVIVTVVDVIGHVVVCVSDSIVVILVAVTTAGSRLVVVSKVLQVLLVTYFGVYPVITVVVFIP